MDKQFMCSNMHAEMCCISIVDSFMQSPMNSCKALPYAAVRGYALVHMKLQP